MSSLLLYIFFFFKQKTAYEMRISDWSSDVCSSVLLVKNRGAVLGRVHHALLMFGGLGQRRVEDRRKWDVIERELARDQVGDPALFLKDIPAAQFPGFHLNFCDQPALVVGMGLHTLEATIAIEREAGREGEW